MGDNRRSVKNVFVNPRQQLRYSFVLVIGSCVTLAIFVTVLIYQVNKTFETLGRAYSLDLEIVGAVQSSLVSGLWMAIGLGALAVVSSVVVAISLSHKIYGPVVAIKRCIESLQNGDYSARLTLRQGDDLLELRDALNHLAESLEKRHPR